MQELQYVDIGGKECVVYSTGHPEVLLIQPSGRHERKNQGIERELEMLSSSCHRDFAMVLFDTDSWAQALMPWPDKAVSRDEAVGRHAADTLLYIEHQLLPWMKACYGTLPCVIGGYSLGGLFALWAACQTDAFVAVAAASPSLWIDHWADYAREHAILADFVYLSLGDKEEHCRNQRMARIGDCVRQQYAMLCEKLGASRVALEWNEGGHFGEEAERTARAFACCMRQI